MRKAYVFALAFLNWNIGNVHSLPSPSHLSTTTVAISQHPRSYDIHLGSRQIRNADYSSKGSSPPGLNPELEATYNSKAHPQTSQGISPASPSMESKPGKIKEVRSIRVRRQHCNLERKYALFLDEHNEEDATPNGTWKYNLENKRRQRLAPGRPVDSPSPVGRSDSDQTHITRAPRKIDGGWWKKKQETIYDTNSSPSPFKDIARAPGVRRAEGEILNGRDASLRGPLIKKGAAFPPAKTKSAEEFSKKFQESGSPQRIASRFTEWTDAKFMHAWNKMP